MNHILNRLFKNTKKLALIFGSLMLAITLAAGSVAVAANGIPDINKSEEEMPAEDFVLNESLDLSGMSGDSVYDLSESLAGMSFNAPASDAMKAAFISHGSDFAKTSDTSSETLQKEAEAALKSALNMDINTVIIVPGEKLTGKTGIISDVFVETGLYVYAVFDASKYTGADDLSALYDDVREFADTSGLTGVIIDGFKAEPQTSSYAVYQSDGAAIGYDNYNNQNTASILKTAVQAVRDASPDLQAGLFAKNEYKAFVEYGFVDFVIIKAYGLEKNESADKLIEDWTKLAEIGGVTAYPISDPASMPNELEVLALKAPAAPAASPKPVTNPVVTPKPEATPAPAVTVEESSEDEESFDESDFYYEEEEPEYDDYDYEESGSGQLIKSVEPDGIVVAESGEEIEITVVAYKDSSVVATINDETMYLYSTGSAEDDDYEIYSGYYIVPDGDYDDAQVLGGLSVYATCGDEEESYDSAFMKTEDSGSSSRTPVQITADQAKTYPANTKNNVPVASLYPLPKGALDYVVGKSFSYKDSKGKIHKYAVLESGMRVETTDIKSVSKGPGGNKISGLSVTAGKDGYTYVAIKTAQMVTYKVGYTSKTFEITFQNTTSVPSSASIKDNVMFSKASFSGKNKLILTFAKTNGFMGYKGYYDKNGNLIFRFNNPPSGIKSAKIAIDPGHGGKDVGAQSTNSKWPEYVLNYNIAKKLESELKARGADVNLMNNNDIEGPERAEKAEKWGADILISVHCNTASNKSASGTEAYYFYPFSKQLAVNSALHVSKRQSIPNRNARQSYYHVTLSSQMASVLVECGFMSNASDYKKLMSSKNQTQIAVGIADAIEGALKTARTGTASTGTASKTAASSETSSSSSSSNNEADQLTVSPTSKTVGVGSTVQLKASSGIDAEVTWKSNRSSVAKVDSTGLVTAVKEGTATITATADDGNGGTTSAKCTITVDANLASETALTADTGIALSKAGNVRIYNDYLTIYPKNSERVEILSQDDQLVRNSDFKWKSSKTSIATVDSKGVVTAKSVGTCTITATGGGYTLVCDINVSRDKVAVTGFSLESGPITVVRGSNYKLKSTISPSNATDKTITWTSSNSKIASVDSSGVVTGVNQGKCTITARTKSGSYKATCNIEVIRDAIEIDDISFRRDTLEIRAGDSDIVSVTVSPSNATSSSLVWSSSRTGVATVDSQGNISALKKGTAIIRVSSANNKDIYAELTLTVVD